MLELKTFLEESYGRLHEWSEAYFVTLIDRCSFLCVSGQRGTIAKSMHEEHLCIVALTSNGARNPVLSACLLPPRVIAYRQCHLLRTAYFARGWRLIDRPKPSTCSYLPCSYLTIRLPPRCSGCLFLFQCSMSTCPIMLCSAVCCAVQQ